MSHDSREIFARVSQDSRETFVRVSRDSSANVASVLFCRNNVVYKYNKTIVYFASVNIGIL